jgi:hypothetical protein
MSTALPNLQQISINQLGHGHKYDDGEHSNTWVAVNAANDTSHDIDIIPVSNFTNLSSSWKSTWQI